MADFCKQCSIWHFCEDTKDLSGLSKEEDTKNKLYCSAICEGCGFIQVDHEGTCVTEGCLVEHASQAQIIENKKLRKYVKIEDDIEF